MLIGNQKYTIINILLALFCIKSFIIKHFVVSFIVCAHFFFAEFTFNFSNVLYKLTNEEKTENEMIDNLTASKRNTENDVKNYSNCIIYYASAYHFLISE